MIYQSAHWGLYLSDTWCGGNEFCRQQTLHILTGSCVGQQLRSSHWDIWRQLQEMVALNNSKKCVYCFQYFLHRLTPRATRVKKWTTRRVFIHSTMQPKTRHRTEQQNPFKTYLSPLLPIMAPLTFSRNQTENWLRTSLVSCNFCKKFWKSTRLWTQIYQTTKVIAQEKPEKDNPIVGHMYPMYVTTENIVVQGSLETT